jgi:hypothetical protein
MLLLIVGLGDETIRRKRRRHHGIERVGTLHRNQGQRYDDSHLHVSALASVLTLLAEPTTTANPRILLSLL